MRITLLHLPALLVLAVAASSSGAGGPPGPPEPPGPPGRILERVVCESDPAQSYALVLPPAYPAGRRWPLLILMDPRGRALVPAGIFVEAASRRGYILASSYGTASDGPAEPNVAAMNALLPDVQRRLAIDPRRIYLAGFSGTARAAFRFAGQLGGHVAGVIAFGGGLPEGLQLTQGPGFAWFGGAGSADFNYEEMLALDARLARLGSAHRFRSFDGPHSWGPAEIAADAIDWMEVRAMRSGLRPADPALVEEISAKWMSEARALAGRGADHEASERYLAVASDLEGLADVSEAASRGRELARSREARRTEAALARRASRQKAYEARLSSFITRFAAATPPPALEESLAELRIASLKSQAAAEGDPDEALAATRLLALVLAHTSFYLPRDFMDRNDPGRALAILRIAAEIEPDSPWVRLGLARARARAGQRAEAIEELRRLPGSPGIDAGLLEADPDLASLRGEAGFREVIEKIRAASGAGAAASSTP